MAQTKKDLEARIQQLDDARKGRMEHLTRKLADAEHKVRTQRAIEREAEETLQSHRDQRCRIEGEVVTLQEAIKELAEEES